jgi:hypothetical protein
MSHWKPDTAANECELCFEPFTTFARRRHHCRDCGGIFCDKCANNRRPVPHRGVKSTARVCDMCMLLPLQIEIVESSRRTAGRPAPKQSAKPNGAASRGGPAGGGPYPGGVIMRSKLTEDVKEALHAHATAVIEGAKRMMLDVADDAIPPIRRPERYANIRFPPATDDAAAAASDVKIPSGVVGIDVIKLLHEPLSKPCAAFCKIRDSLVVAATPTDDMLPPLLEPIEY